MSKWTALFEKKKQNDKKEKYRSKGIELEKQEKYEEAYLKYEKAAKNLLHDHADIINVSDITNRGYVPRGMTAMFDAIGRTISGIGQELAVMQEACILAIIGYRGRLI